MEHWSLNVYRWGAASQDGLIAECLGPAVRTLRASGLVRRFFYHRFDVRGPHVGAVVGVPTGRGDELRAALGERIGAYLASHPCPARLTGAELAARHAACRGAELSAIDAQPGFARNDSWALAPQPADGHLLRALRGVAAEDELWALLGGLAEWTMAEIGAGLAAFAAPRWIAAVDGALGRTGMDAEACWRHYALSLVYGLRAKLEAGEDAAVAGLVKLLGEANLRRLDAVWREVDAAPPAWPGVDRLVEVVLADDGRPFEDRLRLLRTINHSVLAQLGQPASLRIPLVLYAWLRSLHALAPC